MSDLERFNEAREAAGLPSIDQDEFDRIAIGTLEWAPELDAELRQAVDAGGLSIARSRYAVREVTRVLMARYEANRIKQENPE